MSRPRAISLWTVMWLVTASLAPCLAAESFALNSGQTATGDVVWVRAASLELMEPGTTSIRSIPLAQLDPASRYRAQLHRRALTGAPGYLDLARLARSWGLLDEARDELWNAARLRGNESEIETELRAIVEAESSRRLAGAHAAIARGEFASAGALLERVVSSGSSAAGSAEALMQQHSAQITEARAALAASQADRQRKRAERRLRKAREAAEESLAVAAMLVAEADAIRIRGIEESWPISRTKWELLEAAAAYVRASNICAAAGSDLPEDDELHARAAELYDAANARLVDCYCDIADAYVIRGNLIDAHEWASVALVVDPDDERALNIRRAARLGGAIRGGGGSWGRRGGWGRGGGYGRGYGYGHGGVADGDMGGDPGADMGGGDFGFPTRGASSGNTYGAPGTSDPGVTTRTRGATSWNDPPTPEPYTPPAPDQR